MDFDKTSFSVDWYTPGDIYTIPKRLSFPKSARISIDDFVPDSPLSFCFSPVDGSVSQQRSFSFVDTPFESARGWTNSAPPSPLLPPDSEPIPTMYDQDLEKYEESVDWRTLASPGLLAVADDCALSGVDLDVSCLDALDEQLLLSPVECFSELCWAAAVREDFTAPVSLNITRSRARSFKRNNEKVPSPTEREYPGSFERTRPVPPRIALPLDVFPHYVSSPSSPSSPSWDTSLMFEKKSLAYFPDTDPEGRFLALPIQGMPMSRRSKKRDPMHTRSLEPLAPPQPARLQVSRSSQTLRVISDAYSTLTRTRRKFPQ